MKRKSQLFTIPTIRHIFYPNTIRLFLSKATTAHSVRPIGSCCLHPRKSHRCSSHHTNKAQQTYTNKWTVTPKINRTMLTHSLPFLHLVPSPSRQGSGNCKPKVLKEQKIALTPNLACHEERRRKNVSRRHSFATAARWEDRGGTISAAPEREISRFGSKNIESSLLVVCCSSDSWAASSG